MGLVSLGYGRADRSDACHRDSVATILGLWGASNRAIAAAPDDDVLGEGRAILTTLAADLQDTVIPDGLTPSSCWAW